MFGFTQEDKRLVVEDAKRETDKNRNKTGKAFGIRDIPDGRGGRAEGVVQLNPLADKVVACETIRIRIILKIAELQGF